MKNLRRASVLIAAILTLSLLICSCGKKDGDAPIGFKEISNDGVSYNLYVPDEWISDISTGVTAAYYSNVDPSNISMMAFDLSGNEVTTVADYWATYEPSLKALFPDFAYDGEPDTVTLDSKEAMVYTYTGTLSDTQYKIMQIVTVKDAQIYIFTYTATADKFDTHFEEVWEILGHFSFT